MSFNPTKIALLIVASTSAMLPALAQEQASKDTGLETILVTAQKRTQNIKEVPISITAMSQEKLQENNISDTVELSSHISNFSVSQSGQGFNVIMRGLGSGPNQGFEQTVGTYVDGIYRGRAHLMRSAFLDVERVEVLRGPQSTLFGKNTTAGALNLINASPTRELEGYISAAQEFEFGQSTLEGAISNSLGDDLQGRFAFRYQDGGGYLTNTAIDQDEVEHKTLIGRGMLAWQPTKDLDVKFTYQKDQDDFDGTNPTQNIAEPALIAANPPILTALGDVKFDGESRKTNPALGEDEGGSYDAEHVTLQVEYDMDDLTLTSVIGLQDYQVELSNDGDNMVLPLIYRPISDEQFNQFSQELRLTSSYDGVFNFISGVYYQTSELDYKEEFLVYPLQIIGARDFSMDSDTWSIFAQMDYEIDQQWSATLGLRYSSEDKDGRRALDVIDPVSRASIPTIPLVTFGPTASAQLRAGFPNGIPGAAYYAAVLRGQQNIYIHDITGTRNENSFSPALTLRYKFDGGMMYGTVQTGAKAGGFDTRANNPDDFEFEDETVTSYEIGSKFTLNDGSADLNVALFNMQFKDLQTSVYDGSTGFFVQNGAKANSVGLEVDGRWMFADNWMLSGNLGWLDFEWKKFQGAKCFNSVALVPDNIEENGVTCDLSGKTNANAPKVSGSVSLEYFMSVSESLELKSNLDMIYKSSYYTNSDLNPFTQQDAYSKLNLRVALVNADAGWQVALLAKNLTDEQTINFSLDTPLIGSGFYSVYSEPGRTISLQFKYDFY
jgi:iron complex outermembrane receptor protein